MSFLLSCLLIGGLVSPEAETSSFCFLPPPELGTPVKTGCTIELDWPSIDGAMDYVVTYSEIGSTDPILRLGFGGSIGRFRCQHYLSHLGSCPLFQFLVGGTYQC
jgi:hypothetical protein